MFQSVLLYFTGRPDATQKSRDAIVNLRQQLLMIDKKEEHLQKKIEEETKKAKANAITNKAAAMAALRRKKMAEQELDKIQGTRFQLEQNINTLEGAALNAQTLAAMKTAAEALKHIQGKMTIDRVEDTIQGINEQKELAAEISAAISEPLGSDLDTDALEAEMEMLQQEQLNEKLMEADHAPVHQPGPSKVSHSTPVSVAEDDEEEQLRKLQAELAM